MIGEFDFRLENNNKVFQFPLLEVENRPGANRGGKLLGSLSQSDEARPAPKRVLR
jgi:hypothetical protein